MLRRLLVPLGQEPEIQVTIDGSGFAQGAAVRFKDTTAAGPVTVKSPTQIVAAVPSRLPAPSGRGTNHQGS
ncbi:hypothetical protein XF35_05325 [Streptomyces platensis subsp. clarensis]|nr:hypothetical protein [Streptomyces platensis subsp. clarensis]